MRGDDDWVDPREAANKATLFRWMRRCLRFLFRVVLRADHDHLIPEQVAFGWLPINWQYHVEWGFEARTHDRTRHERKISSQFVWFAAAHHAGLAIRFSGGVQLFVCIPYVFGCWITAYGPVSSRLAAWAHRNAERGLGRPLHGATEVGFRIHSGALWWDFFSDEMGWHSTDPEWRHGNFDLADFLLGGINYSSQQLVVHENVPIQLPEGTYYAKATRRHCEWRRPRWPVWPFISVRDDWYFDIEHGIPYSGKGENSWDCGEDGTFGVGSSLVNLDEAAAEVAAGVLKMRRRRFDPQIWPEEPAARVKRINALREKNRAESELNPPQKGSP